MTATKPSIAIFIILSIIIIQCQINAFVISPNGTPKPPTHYIYSKLYQSQEPSSETNLSRRDIVRLVVGGTLYAKVVGSCISKVKRGDAYPPDHEARVANVFKRSILEAASSKSYTERPLRVLEVGIGAGCRTIMRGLYDGAFTSLSDLGGGGGGVSGIEFVGVDIDTPSDDIVKAAKERLVGIAPSIPVSLNVMNADIVEGLSTFPDGYFDAITCSLVLCSVSDQGSALKEIKRVLNHNGGTFGYVEHVAVNLENNEEKGLSFLELQQRALDPLQQAVAHNCHLHRDTDNVISSAFGVDGSGSAKVLETERFLIEDMWPVSCQCSGVVKLNG